MVARKGLTDGQCDTRVRPDRFDADLLFPRFNSLSTMCGHHIFSFERRVMQLNVEQKKLLRWIEAKQPVIGIFHVMTDLRPMIDKGLIESRPVAGARGRLVITDVGKTALRFLN